MSIKFYWLWLMWFSGVVYDVIVANMHWFAERGLAERLTDDFQIAWFIFTAWIAGLLIQRTPHDTIGAKVHE